MFDFPFWSNLALLLAQLAMAIQGSTRILGFDEVGAFQYPIDDDPQVYPVS
jgi:hypothetical protein